MTNKQGRTPKSADPAPAAPIDCIVQGDCISFLGDHPKVRPDLIFADPPFNIGYKYDKYEDELPHERYVHWTTEWMAACAAALADRGSFYIAIGDEYAAEVCLAGKELGLTLRNWIIWHYTFGQSTKNKFARSHAHIFYFVRDAKNFTFNDMAVREPSDRQLIYNDARANPAGKIPDDVWTVSRVCGTFKERVQWHPCQMPEKLLERIVAASSNPGDLVFDPFAGSGTTLAAARRLGRHYLGTDISGDYVRNANERLAAVKPEPEKFTGQLEPFLPPPTKRPVGKPRTGRKRRKGGKGGAEQFAPDS